MNLLLWAPSHNKHKKFATKGNLYVEESVYVIFNELGKLMNPGYGNDYDIGDLNFCS